MSSTSITSGPYRKLRIMIVDDNRINLSVLSTLLKRRFNTLLEDQPVTVDSGLKAIQLLRTNVFDLILMDIQMPFLSGLEASIRIRNGDDGVLEANRAAHIVAVTTAVGDEPELAYRRAGMDGMIGKPVRFQDMEHYICPLAHEAHNAASSVLPVDIHGQSIMPPLPPTLATSDKRLFYLPANAEILSPCPDICKGADFEKRLRAQTRDSLRLAGAMAIARSGTWSESSRLRKTDSGNAVSIKEIEEPAQAISSVDPHRESSPKRGHLRGPSLTINSRTYSQQIARELASMEGSGELSDSGSASESTMIASRPKAVHRTSSPAWLLTSENNEADSFTSPTHTFSSADRLSPKSTLRRPKWLTEMKRKGSSNDGSVEIGSPITSSSSSYSATSPQSSSAFNSPTWNLRRASEMSNYSFTSESSDVATPENEEPAWPQFKSTIAEKRSSGETITFRLPREGKTGKEGHLVVDEEEYGEASNQLASLSLDD